MLVLKGHVNPCRSYILYSVVEVNNLYVHLTRVATGGADIWGVLNDRVTVISHAYYNVYITSMADE